MAKEEKTGAVMSGLHAQTNRPHEAHKYMFIDAAREVEREIVGERERQRERKKASLQDFEPVGDRCGINGIASEAAAAIIW
jgi:hypothetical protein